MSHQRRITTAYHLCTSRWVEDLNREIERMLQQGWELYGDPFAIPGCVGQALVKTEEPPSDPDAFDGPIG